MPTCGVGKIDEEDAQQKEAAGPQVSQCHCQGLIRCNGSELFMIGTQLESFVKRAQLGSTAEAHGPVARD